MARTLINKFDERIKEKRDREKEHITRKQIKEESGLPQSTVDNWLRGRVTRFDAHVLAGWCDWFECELTDLIELVDDA
jgi:transcriptional regulator with XRE-family HTH domain